MSSLQPKRLVLVAAVLVVGAAIYYPGLHGPFLLDDRENILKLPHMAMQTLDTTSIRDAAFSWGRPYPHRGLARLSFALNHYFAGGFDRVAFKATNLAVHVLNGLLVYCLSVLLLRRFAGGARSSFAEAGWSAMQGYLPLMVTAVWLLHPIQLTSVLYVVQRMTSLAALFVFLGLVVFVVGRIRVEAGKAQGWSLMLVGLGGGVVLGFLCKQNAVLLPFYAFLVELFFFRRETLTEASRRRLRAFYAVTVGLPVLVGLAGLVFAWDAIAEGYLHRSFTPYERVLTQSRVLFFYLGLIFFPHIRSFGLYHDDIAPSTGLLEPWTTLVALVLWAVLAGLSLWGVRRRWVWSFGLLWYLVGHALESSVVGLELVFEHRNYVPSFGVLFAATFYVAWGLERLSAAKRLAYPLVAVIIGVLAFTTFTRAGIWRDKATIVEFALRNHPESARSHGEYALVNAQRVADIELVFSHWQRAAALNPGSVLELIEMERILAAQILAIDPRAGELGGPAPDDPSVDPLSAGLVADAAYLRALERAVAAEVAGRLATRPVRMGNVAALRELQLCIQSKLTPCVALLERALEWTRIAVDNPRQQTTQRALLQLVLAKLRARRGDIAGAVESARAASLIAPDRVYYLFELASLHLVLGDLDAAERTIRAAEETLNRSGFGSGLLEDLKRELEQSRAAAEARAASGG